MQILSPQINVSDAVSSNSRRAARLLSPNVVQLDTRAFDGRPAERTSSTLRVYWQMFFAVVVSAMLVAKWAYLPSIYSSTEAEASAQPITSLMLPVALEIDDVELRKISVNGRKIALVAGHIINRSGKKLPIPQLNIVLHQKDGQNVTSWRYRPQPASLKAGASLRFTSNFNTDVKDGSVVEIQFVSKGDR
ncbi:MAG: hypothetical protein JKX91_14900 [Rhizobiaceae bacterium]|nr:hypothetical protein [Rhizobiaceae bacterium]